MPDDTTRRAPAEIAARLTPAEKKALQKMPTDLSQKSCRIRLSLFLDGLQYMGSVTALGAEVRRIVAQEAQRDG